MAKKSYGSAICEVKYMYFTTVQIWLNSVAYGIFYIAEHLKVSCSPIKVSRGRGLRMEAKRLIVRKRTQRV